MNSRLIVIDGKTYNSVNEMPPDVRAQYEQAMNTSRSGNQGNMPDGFGNMNIPGDKNNNGLPDAFENMSTTNVISSGMKFIVSGQEYNSLDTLPPEARAKYEQAMENLDKNLNGIPDFVEGMIGMTGGTQTPMQQNPQAIPTPRSASYAPQSDSPTITPDTSNGWLLALAALFVLGLCAVGAVGIWYFFMQ